MIPEVKYKVNMRVHLVRFLIIICVPDKKKPVSSAKTLEVPAFFRGNVSTALTVVIVSRTVVVTRVIIRTHS